MGVEIKSYTDLEVWQRARAIIPRIYKLTGIFPKTETYSLASQMQRAAISILSNIAEGYSRRGLKDYIQFVSMAIGSACELDTQLYVVQDLEYASEKQLAGLREELTILQKQLYSLRQSLEKNK